MAGTISISIASPGDARALATLRSAVARDMTRQFGKGPWSGIPGRSDVLRQLRASRVLIARRNGELIGTVRLALPLPWAFQPNPFTPVDQALYVFGLAVSPAARGQGIGRQLMDAAKQAARSRGAQALWLDAYDHAAGAGAFYLQCGFREVGRSGQWEVPLRVFEWLANK
jgi:ribosomal protein S18 acetylase RimI-like enzyme